MRLLRFRRHPVSEEQLSAYLDGRLSASDKERIDSHIRSCGACAGKLAETRALAAELQRLPRVKAPRSFAISPQMAAELRRDRQTQQRTSARRAYLGLSGATAAAALVLIGLVAGTALMSSGNNGTPASGPVAASRQTAASPESKSLAPAAPENPPLLGSAQATPPSTDLGTEPPALMAPPETGPADESQSGGSVPGEDGLLQATPNAAGQGYSYETPSAPASPGAVEGIAAQEQSAGGFSHWWLWPLYGVLGALVAVFGASAVYLRRRWRRLNRNT